MKKPNSRSGRSTEARFAKKDMAVVKVVAAVLLAASGAGDHCEARNGDGNLGDFYGFLRC